MSALGDEIKAMIASEGPITLERYMELALGHPEHGYYMGRDPFGAAGDFITAPEISQMFGELLGLWAAEVWASMGRPRPVRLIELGPGRGTMMSDALRAARIVPDFRSAIDVTLVETSPTLAEIQHETLLTSGAPVGWIPTLAEAPEGPAIVLANEFLDACRRGNTCAAAGAGASASSVSTNPANSNLRSRENPSLSSWRRARKAISSKSIRPRTGWCSNSPAASSNKAASRCSSIMATPSPAWAIRCRPCEPTAWSIRSSIPARRTSPHMSISPRWRAARARPARRFTARSIRAISSRSIGIDGRTRALAERASPDRAGEFELARQRLVGKNEGEMGAFFKVMAIANRAIAPPPGFEPDPPRS